MVKKNRDAEILMIAAASRALEIKAEHPSYEFEEILKKVMVSLDYGELRGDRESKIKAIAAIDRVLKLKRQYPKLTNKQLIQKLVDDSKKNFVNEEQNE
jgi:hypothetical protein